MSLHNQLEPLLPGLSATPAAPMPYLAEAELRSFVLDVADGRVIVYNSPTIGDADIGRPQALLINHWHENMYGTPDLDVPVFVHEKDRARCEPALRIAGTFAEPGMIFGEIEVIPSGGHTAGATFFRWEHGGHRFLFPGDSLWVDGDTWRAVILEESDSRAFLDTLLLVRELDFDVLVPWISMRGELPYEVVPPERKRSRIDGLIERVRRGDRGVRV